MQSRRKKRSNGFISERAKQRQMHLPTFRFHTPARVFYCLFTHSSQRSDQARQRPFLGRRALPFPVSSSTCKTPPQLLHDAECELRVNGEH